ncbi:RagB/SusD family nutrient uptake outer membrane protein [Sphingobacterium sp. MYb382]|uniref:RagB/SusD family nutrient uptake outer membrane protein n=1 Tax=Sphingobacterium sp. MYb382 TaxID=2745278 RepID=UPI0030978766
MKIFKIKYKVLGLMSGAIALVSSCNIDVVPQDRFVEENVWKNEANVEMYVNGMYAEFRRFQFTFFPGLGYDNAMDALADGMKFTSNTAGNGTVNLFIGDAGRYSPASVGLNYWNSGYDRIRRVNEFLDGLHKSSLNEGAKARFEAEARFVRAYCYFWLAKLHGSVVLLQNIDEYSVKDHPRASEGVIYDFILADLDYAAQNLPTKVATSKADKGSAYALKARVALHAASIARFDKKQFNTDELTGIPEAKADAYYGQARDAAQAVIDLGMYALADDFATVFTAKESKEAIYKVTYIAPDVVHQYDAGYAPPRDAEGQTSVYGVPTANIVDEFEMADGTKFSWSNPVHAAAPYANREKRFYASILHNGAAWKGRVLNTTVADVKEGFIPFGQMSDPKRTVTGYYTKKFLDPNNTTFVQNKSTQHWIELRYAEVYLVLAEAKAQLNDFSGSVTALNALRQKRGLPDVNYNTITDAMARVEHERIVELAFEGQRFWDLRRLRKAHILLDGKRVKGHKITPEGSGYTYEFVDADIANREFPARLYYLPIPEAEIQKNKGLTQIKGW